MRGSYFFLLLGLELLLSLQYGEAIPSNLETRRRIDQEARFRLHRRHGLDIENSNVHVGNVEQSILEDGRIFMTAFKAGVDAAFRSMTENFKICKVNTPSRTHSSDIPLFSDVDHILAANDEGKELGIFDSGKESEEKPVPPPSFAENEDLSALTQDKFKPFSNSDDSNESVDRLVNSKHPKVKVFDLVDGMKRRKN